jgi:hypothetical protein
MAIDKTKGVTYSPPPSHWSKKQKYIQIPDGATQEEIDSITEQNREIQFQNNICCSKKTYFFGYVYPQKMREYKQHKKAYNNMCYIKFGMGINDLIRIVDKSPEQKKLLKEYYQYSPLFNSKCSMNILAKYIEDFDFKYKFAKNTHSFDYTCLMSCDESEINKVTLSEVRTLLKRYTKLSNDITVNLSYLRRYLDADEAEETRGFMFDELYNDFFVDVVRILGNEQTAVNYVVYACYGFKNTYQKSLLWYCLGDYVAENVKNNSKHRYKIVQNDNGKPYFGKNYTLIDEYKE